MKVEMNGVMYTQASNGHVIGVKDSRIIFHAQYNKIMSESELLEYVKLVDELRDDEKDSDK